MNMPYRKGEFVGYVTPTERPLSVPLPQRWYILQVMPGRDAKVMQAFHQRHISAYWPTVVRTIDRRDGGEARRPHLGRTIVKAFLPGLIFLPDFQLDNLDEIEALDYVAGLLKVGECLARLKVEEMQLLRLISQTYNVPLGERKYALNQIVRIVDGPFAGLIAQIERLDSNGRLRVFLDAVMRGVSADVAETQIEPVVVRKRAKAERRRARL